MSETTKTELAVDPRVIKALGHPLRQRILHVLNARVASPSEIAEELDEPLGNVSYHVKTLLGNDAIELVETAPVRGAVEHFYRATMRPSIDDADWAKLPASSRRALFDDTLQRIWDEIEAAARGDGLDGARTHISLTRLELDERAREQLADHLEQTIDLALRLEAESRERVAADDHSPGSEPTEIALMHFRRPSSRSARSIVCSR